MNAKPGGKQKILRDTSAKSNGCIRATDVIHERWSKSQHADFKFEKSEVEKFLIRRGHIPTFLPKFHPELSKETIERVWAQLKRFAAKEHAL